MAKRIRPVSHQEELTLVEHLEELRTRLLTVAIAFFAVLAIAFWQNKRLLELINDPLPAGQVPATFGVSEAFMSTITVSIYAALIITLPLIFWHLYAFVVPAFSEQERQIATPLLLMAPLLFIGGAVFGYFIVLPAAVGFLLTFNENEFNILVRAREYYSFFGLMMVSMGLLFELPLAILIATRLGFVTPLQLRQNRRYALIAIAVVAMLLPGTDPVSMVIEMVPLVALYEISIWVAVWFGRSTADATQAEDAIADSEADSGVAMR